MEAVSGHAVIVLLLAVLFELLVSHLVTNSLVSVASHDYLNLGRQLMDCRWV